MNSALLSIAKRILAEVDAPQYQSPRDGCNDSYLPPHLVAELRYQVKNEEALVWLDGENGKAFAALVAQTFRSKSVD
jgi:hypothetical protein